MERARALCDSGWSVTPSLVARSPIDVGLGGAVVAAIICSTLAFVIIVICSIVWCRVSALAVEHFVAYRPPPPPPLPLARSAAHVVAD
jgi:hypothetical protein